MDIRVTIETVIPSDEVDEVLKDPTGPAAQKLIKINDECFRNALKNLEDPDYEHTVTANGDN